ncbi:hypothetical protein F4824DRAFT_348153 [Ustulina deusta]|nr:hypothetical protein F4824DRAFT_348153 [Ustulina deusta]
MEMILHDLRAAYNGKTLVDRPSFHDWAFHIYSSDMSESKSFWKGVLEGSSMTYLTPPPVPATGSPCVDNIRFHVPLKNVSTSYGTPSSVLQAAWALVLSAATGRDDVVFCAPNANRSLSSFPDMDQVCGLCLNFLPVRARLQDQATFRSLIQQMQVRAIAAIQHQHQGFRSIVRDSTDWAPWTRYGSMLIYQNHEAVPESVKFGGQDCPLTLKGNFGRTADILVEATPSRTTSTRADEPGGEEEDLLVVDMLYSRSTFTEDQARWLSSTLSRILEALPRILEQPVGQVRGEAVATAPYVMSEPAAQHSSTTAANAAGNGHKDQQLAGVRMAWDEIGLSAARNDLEEKGAGSGSMFACGADLVDTLLLSRYYRRSGHDVSMQQLIDHPTQAEQARLLGKAKTRLEYGGDV